MCSQVTTILEQAGAVHHHTSKCTVHTLVIRATSHSARYRTTLAPTISVMYRHQIQVAGISRRCRIMVVPVATITEHLPLLSVAACCLSHTLARYEQTMADPGLNNILSYVCNMSFVRSCIDGREFLPHCNMKLLLHQAADQGTG